jgi:hypothetical protein
VGQAIAVIATVFSRRRRADPRALEALAAVVAGDVRPRSAAALRDDGAELMVATLAAETEED